MSTNPTTPHTFIIPMSRERLEAARTHLAEAKFPIAGDEGTAKYRGVTFGYFFYTAHEGTVLRFQILKKSWIASLVSDESIEQQVRDFFTDLEIAEDAKRLLDVQPPEEPPCA